MPVYLQRTSHMVHAYRKTKCMCMCYTHTHTPHTSNACYCGFSMYVNWTDYRMHVLGVSFWPSAMPLSGCQRLSFLVYFILHSHCLPLSPPYRRSRARARSTWIPWLGLCNDISVCVCVCTMNLPLVGFVHASSCLSFSIRTKDCKWMHNHWKIIILARSFANSTSNIFSYSLSGMQPEHSQAGTNPLLLSKPLTCIVYTIGWQWQIWILACRMPKALCIQCEWNSLSRNWTVFDVWENRRPVCALPLLLHPRSTHIVAATHIELK